MTLLTTLAGQLNKVAWWLISRVNAKARKIVDGRRETIARIRQRLSKERPTIWFHVASLGEFEQGRPLMEAVRRDYPEWQILVSFFSPSGYEVRHSWEGADCVVYLPADTPHDVEEFIREAQPRLAVFVKYDLWPVMLERLQRRGVPSYLVSAIFQRRQFFFHPLGRGYLRLLHYFDYLWVQDKASVELLSQHGIYHADVAGDTRFDRAKAIAEGACELPEIEPLRERMSQLIVAGSTHPADEEALSKYLAQTDSVGLLLAPHEIDEEHLCAIEAMLPKPSVRLSQLREGKQVLSPEIAVIIIDSFGLLASLYRYADVAYIGGGFGKGIHNTVEAAVYGLPMVFGPRIERFREAQLFVSEGAAFVASRAEEVSTQLTRLLANPEERTQAAAQARKIVDAQLGATDVLMANLGLSKLVRQVEVSDK